MTKASHYRSALVAGAFLLGQWSTALIPRASADAQVIALPEANGPMFGIHYGIPLKWSLALGAPLPGALGGWKPFIAVEPGLGGWRASTGAGKFTNDLGSGWLARATVLRATSKAWRAPPQATYVGPELQFMPLFAIGARAGALVRVGGKSGERGLLTIDASLMF